MNDFDKGYVAGIIVGEGSFTGSKGSPSLAVKMNDDDPEPIQRLKELLGGKINGPYYHDNRHYFLYQLRGKELKAAVPLLEEILPPSRKRRQFEVWKVKYILRLECNT